MVEDLTRENDNNVRWREYFVLLMNGDEIREKGEDIRTRKSSDMLS